MTYIKRTYSPDIGGQIKTTGERLDLDHPLCGDCLEDTPGWNLVGAHSSSPHAHQPDGWIAATTDYTWGREKGDTKCCDECGANLSEIDARTWGVYDKDQAMARMERLAAKGHLLYKEPIIGSEVEAVSVERLHEVLKAEREQYLATYGRRDDASTVER